MSPKASKRIAAVAPGEWRRAYDSALPGGAAAAKADHDGEPEQAEQAGRGARCATRPDLARAATAVRLAPGRYRYAFLVNGVEWRADPAAPVAKDDEFGTPSSVVTVGGKRL